MKKYERITGMIFILIGVADMIYSVFTLSLGNFHKPGPGFFPLLCGLVLVIFSAIWIFTKKEGDEEEKPFWEKGQWVKPLIAVVVITVYGAIMEDVGYLLSTFVFLLAWQIFIEREKWVRTLLISVIGTITMYFLFIYLLGVPLPEGILSI